MRLKQALAISKPTILSEHDSNSAKFRYIDLFAGVGGIRIPFDELGGQCVFSSEWDRFAQDTYEKNFGHRPSGDIMKVAASRIPSHDLLLAGFPCQAFSLAGLKQGFYDTRGTMFFEIQRILAHHKPKMFLLENVKQLKSHDGGRTLSTIKSILQGEAAVSVPDDVPMTPEARKSLSVRLNYNVTFQVLRAPDFGVPQNRERVYIVGFNKDYFGDLDLDNFFNGLDGREITSCLGDALEAPANVPVRYTLSDKLWQGLVNRMARHAANGNGFGHKVSKPTDDYCNTITSRYYKDGREILIDQSSSGANPRRLMPRECARIQGFPEWFDLTAASDTQLYRQFGNSVSVPVIRSVANSMLELLTAHQVDRDIRNCAFG
jgi:DNA (cytosine-5)-methyltransferase 1